MELGGMTHAEMLDRLSARELTWWRAFLLQRAAEQKEAEEN